MGAGLVVLLCLLAVEVGLRFSRIHTGGYIYQPDPWTGSALIPNSRAVHAREGFSILRINSLGIRDHETTLSKPTGVFRIAMLGDSYLEAAQVALGDSVAKVLERRLQPYGPFEVLNFGHSGYGTAQEYLQLREFTMNFDPDLVIACVCIGNDIRNNHEKLNGIPFVPYFVLDSAGGLELDASFREEPKYQAVIARDESLLGKTGIWIWNHSRLAGLIFTALRSPGQSAPVNRPGDPLGPVDPRFHGDWAVYDPQPTGIWQESWIVTEKLILQMADLCRERDVSFAVVLVTNSPQVAQVHRKMFAEEYPHLDLDYPNRRLMDLCRQHRIACLNLVPPFLAHHRKTGEFLHGFGQELGRGHWNEAGHRLAADHIHEFLIAEHLLPATRPAEADQP